MAKTNLLLVLCFQLALAPTLAQESAPSEQKAPMSSTETTATTAPAPPPPPRPKLQKPVCKIIALNGLTSVQWNNRTVTRPIENFTTSIAYLKQLVEKGYCLHRSQNCSVMAQAGQSAISIDGEQAAPLKDGPLFTVRDLQELKNTKLKDPKNKESNLCKMIEPTYSVLTVDGQFAVYIDANQASPFVRNESSAQESLAQFIDPANWNSLDSALPSRPSVINSNENKIKNIKCWKGNSLAQQDKNLKLCTKASKYNQTCETSMFVHEQSVYDVCLQGFEGKANRLVECFKSNSKAQMKENLAHCKTQLLPAQICETDPKIHGHEVSEVCILE